MPFQPDPVSFCVTDTDKPVTFSKKANSPPPWDVITVTFVSPTRTVTLDATRWSFPTDQIKDDTADADKINGTLCLDHPAKDAMLTRIWPTAQGAIANLTLAIRCNGIAQTLTVQLTP